MIIASTGQEHLRDQSTQAATWARHGDVNVIWLLGGEDTSFNHESRILTVKSRETYENILEKTILGIKWCLANVDFDCLVRGNVSTYFRTDKMEKLLASLDDAKPSFGGYIDFLNDKSLPSRRRSFVNGGAILLNRQAALLLSGLEPHNWLNNPDDYAISQYLMNTGIAPVYAPRGNIAFTSLITNRAYFRLKSSNLPEMASLRMIALHDVLNSKTLLEKARNYKKFYLNELNHVSENYGTLDLFMRSVYSVISSVLKARFFKVQTKE